MGAIVIVVVVVLTRRGRGPAAADEYKELNQNGSFPLFGIRREDLTIGSQIGRGAFGVVYEGKWKGLRVAIKWMHHQDEETLAELEREADLMTCHFLLN